MQNMCDKRQKKKDMCIFAKKILKSMYKKHGIWPLKTAQKVGLRKSANTVIFISK
jgi:hypothetical protein